MFPKSTISLENCKTEKYNNLFPLLCNRQSTQRIKRPPSPHIDVEIAVNHSISISGFAFLWSIHREERFRPSLTCLAPLRHIMKKPNQVAVRIQIALLLFGGYFKNGIEISFREELFCQRCILANLYQSKVTISCDASYSIGQVSFGESANRISNITLLCSLNNPFLLILMV